MGGLGWSEILVVGVVALVVVDPKDLPVLMRRLGRWRAQMGHLRAQLASEMAKMEQDVERAVLPSTPPAPPAPQTPTPDAKDGTHGTGQR